MAKKDSKNLKKLEQETAELKARQQQEQEKLRRQLEELTPEELKQLPVNRYVATLQALDIVQDIMQGKREPEQLQGEILERTQIALLPFELITSSIAMDKGGEKKGQAVAILYSDDLNPSKPQFDAKAYREELQELAPQIEKANELINQYGIHVAQVMLAAIPQALKDAAAELLANIPGAVNSLRRQVETIAGIDWDLIDYIGQVLDSPKYAELNAKVEAEHWDMSDLQKADEWQDILQEAKKLKAAAETTQLLYNLKEIKHHPIMKSKALALPFDPFNTAQNNARQVNGQITMLPIAADHKTKKGKGEERHTVKQELTSYYSISFAETLPPEIARKLDQTDALLYGGLDACMQTNGNLLTFPELYRAMGYKKKPDAEEKAELIRRMQKMQGAFVYFDFAQEQAAYKNSDYANIGKSWKEGTPLLHFETREDVFVNGQQVDDAIIILDAELPLYRAARNQNYKIADVPIECLQLPGRMQRNDRTLSMVFYTLRQISKMKEPKDTKTEHTFLYSTLYERCGVKAEGGTDADRKERQRLRDNFFKYLDHLISIHHIAGYREKRTDEGKPGTKIFIDEAELETDRKKK